MSPPPIAPMLAKLSATIPDGEGWSYEPKWDGFRCIVVRDGDAVELTSRNERPFTRYFPELLEPLAEQLPERCMIDGEIVVPGPAGLDFDALLQRIHPAESRVRRLAAETPASFVAFDLLGLGDLAMLERPLAERRAVLETVFADCRPPIHLTPASSDIDVARRWFERFEGAGLDGIVAKRLDAPYTPGLRTMTKVKHLRSAECAVAGYRIHKDGQGIGSLLLGLYDERGQLHHVGVAAGFSAARRRELLAELEPLTAGAADGHPWGGWLQAMAGEAARRSSATGHSRWNAGKDLSFTPVRVERVAEVTFGQLTNGRFRHGVGFVRWRPDRSPQSCRYEQLDVAEPVAFETLFGAPPAPHR